MKRRYVSINRALAAALICLLVWLGAAPVSLAWSGEERPYFATLVEAQPFIQECIGETLETFSFYLPVEQVEAMGTGEFKRELILMTGEARCHVGIIYESRTYARIYMKPTYYPGTRIVKAWREDNLDMLSEEERQTLDCALTIVREEKAESETLLVLEKRLHDRICQLVTYEPQNLEYEGETIQRVCTAVGALLDGRANCQGYTDAFYLLGTLAGLKVGRQNGTDASGEDHMWNTIEWINGWYAVDVTADDTDLTGNVAVNYTYFNMGRDLCEGVLSWPEHYETADIIDLTDTTYFYYTKQEAKYGRFGEAFTDMAALSEYVYSKRLNQSQPVVWVMLCNQSATADDLHEALKAEAVAQGHKSSATWTAWTWNVGKHTYYMVRWNKF